MKNSNQTLILPVTGMSCASCASSVESMTAAIKGVESSAVNYANQSLKITFNETEIKLSEIQKAVQSIGYDLIIDTENAEEKQEELILNYYLELKQKTIFAAVLSLPIVIIGMFLMHMPYANWIMLALATPVVFYFGSSFFINAIKQARHGKANMDTLVALSTGIAYIFSLFNTIYPDFWLSRGVEPHVYFEAAAVVIVFIMLGKLLEERAKTNASSAIKKLIGLQPKTVRVIQGQTEKEILISDVKVGDQILVRSGEKIPVDGLVYEGSSFVDESMISGEPVAVEKLNGSKVFAGTINQKGSFKFKAEKVGSETMLAQIIQMVKDAQGSKAPVQRLVDKIAGVFVPVVILISILSLVAWIILGGENGFTHGLLAMVTVLVIACPCALGLATPTAIMVGVGKGAENGILIKDAESLESGHKVNAVILDKTGTITNGKPLLTDIIWNIPQEEQQEFSRILLAIESSSEHPLAAAIVMKLAEQDISAVSITDFESLTGRGAKAKFSGETYFAGSHHLLSENNIEVPQEINKEIKYFQEKAKTVIYFSSAHKLLAVIALADQIKTGSVQAIAELQNKGIDVYMLTGDNSHTASAVAKEVGISNFKAEVLPAGKYDFVKQLQKEGKIVAMVGDGINDSQALAQANVSIAMGKGSDIAIDVAKMTIISSDLNKISQALNLSKQTVKTIKQNLFWAFIYNLIGIPIAAGLLYPFNGFLLNPMIAGAAMALSSVSVVSNSLRLKWQKL
ncbi:heavy metal translocating P-type ATPase [Daejeonella oryzae]|uniref:heavy metal translocating P-type ATPase n=1 Tax=Daejeonella oryzae TaxID=1122943 RepID=UPI00047DB612|nr:heavy metal translocating P-type ATPase [Daejeonella oryzae]